MALQNAALTLFRIRIFALHTVTEILVDRFEGKRLNSPNDVVVKRDGSIWFTDPPYGILSNHEGYAAESGASYALYFFSSSCIFTETHGNTRCQ